ncbi:MAG: hypothetical protein KJ077_10910 [Anaerolineae bacterium]|nr:hypothetical protein [Anaerolineae bacterium]
MPTPEPTGSEETKSALVKVTVHRTYKVWVDLPKGTTKRDAEEAVCKLGSLAIHEAGEIENVDVDWPEFQEWGTDEEEEHGDEAEA